MKKLIFLSGKASCGKTTTLKMLMAMLASTNGVYTVTVKHLDSRSKSLYNNILTAWQNGTIMPDGDISIVFDIDGILVGIRTEGDCLGAVWAAIDYFEKKFCDIGVLACHSEHLKRSFPCMIAPWSCHEIIDKGSAPDSSLHEQENKDTAQTLFEKIMDAVNQIEKSQQTCNQKSTTKSKN